MKRLSCAVVTLGLLAGQLAAEMAPAKQKTSHVFGLTKVWQFHLVISAQDWDKMQPLGGMRGPGGFPGFGGPEGPKQPPKQPADKPPAERPTDVHKSSGFGTEFPWVHAEFSTAGKTYKNVGIRFKGNASYMATARGLKRNFKIELDRYDEDLRFEGLKTITLNSGGMDPGRGREALSYAVFRAAGVPAPRTAFAEVTLTMPGKHDKEYLGLYTFVEHVDKTFLKNHFKNGKGLLMKPERMRGLEYLGEGWDNYTSKYRPKHEATKKEARRVIEFARLVNKADDEQFQKQIGSYLDVDAFLRFVAVNALLANLDSFFTIGHNYYLYLNPETNKFAFIPWDLDLSLAGFPMSGAPEQQMDLSLSHPHAGDNKLIDRLMSMKAVKEKYQHVLKELAATCFTKDRLLSDVDAIEKTTQGPLAREKKAAADRKEGVGGFGPKAMFGAASLRAFVEKRTASVTAQLAGTSKGYVPAMSFGPGGFGPGMFLVKPVFAAADANKDGKVSKEEFVGAAKRFFEVCDTAMKGSLDEKALAEGINRLLPPPPPKGPGPAGPGPFGPGPGFGPGVMVAGIIFKKAGVERTEKLTLPQFLKAAEVIFQECDKDKSGTLDEKEIASGIGLAVPRPPGFGPPGFGPPGGFPQPPRPEAQPKKEDRP